MTRRLLLFCIVIFYGAILPAHALENCVIDVAQVIAALGDAQSTADGGDTATALDQITDARNQLNDIIRACQAGQLFEQTFISGPLSFTYPEGWQLQNPQQNIYLFGTSPAAIATIFQENLQEPISSGQHVMAIIVANYQSDFNTDSYAEFLSDFSESVQNGSTRVSPAPAREIGPYRWDIFDLTSNGMRGALYLYDVGDSERALVVLSIAPVEEYEASLATADRILASLRFGETPAFAQPSTEAPRQPSDGSSGIPLASLTYTRAEPYETFIGDEVRPEHLIVSPDGQSIGWIESRGDGRVCVQALENGIPSCVALPENYRGPTLQFLWSPDGRYIAFTEDLPRYLNESDVWLYDVQNGSIINRTDDGVDRLRLGEPAEKTIWADGPLAWSPDGTLYFIRLDVPESSDLMDGNYGLYRLQPDSGETALVRDLTNIFEIVSIYAQPFGYFDGPMSVSPDGEQIAFIVFERTRESIKNGVWALALDGQSAPKQVMRPFDLRDGLPIGTDEDYFSIPVGLAWSGDGQSIFVFGDNIRFSRPNIIYRIRPNDFAVDVLTDYSDVTQSELLGGDDPLIRTTPHMAIMSSDRSAPIILTFDTNRDEAQIQALIPSADNTAERRTLFTLSDFQLRPNYSYYSMATNGIFNLMDYIFFPAP